MSRKRYRPMQQESLFDPPFWAIQTEWSERMLGPCDHHCAPGYTEDEARAYWAKAAPGEEILNIMPEDEWDAQCNAKYGDKWPVLKAAREKDE